MVGGQRSKQTGRRRRTSFENPRHRLSEMQIQIFTGQRRMHAFHLYTMQIRILLRLQQAIQDGRQMRTVRVLCEAGTAFASSAKLSILFARQRAARVADTVASESAWHRWDAMALIEVLNPMLCLFAQINDVDFNTDPFDGPQTADENEDGAKARAKNLCPMPIQKETPTGLVDTVCNGDVAQENAGLCR